MVPLASEIVVTTNKIAPAEGFGEDFTTAPVGKFGVGNAVGTPLVGAF